MNINALLNNAQVTVFIGKNGCGKSTLLRNIDQSDQPTRYISPERGGSLKYDPGTDNQMSTNSNWLVNQRRKNRVDQFRQQSTAQFRNLETLILREIEQDKAKREDFGYTFNSILDSINDLLPAIQMMRSERGFSISSKQGEAIDEDQISSGEAELIALAIECLVFSRDSTQDKILLLDEPDVHLHPDLQHRFMSFLLDLIAEHGFKVVIATHSTAILSGVDSFKDVQVVPMTARGQNDFSPFRPDDISRQLLPVFGIHPLANHFNARPILLVEGEDDRRVIEQLVRSSEGRYNYSPSVVGSVNEMTAWESWLDTVLPAIYDDPRAFSLRDLDDAPDSSIDNIGCVTRARLNCHAIENLLLTRECLDSHNFEPQSFIGAINAWVESQPDHQSSSQLRSLAESFEDRRRIKVKDVRNILCALLGTNKPWEVVVGQMLATTPLEEDDDPNSLFNFLGAECVGKVFS
ncbi:MAG: AAA family ATPase [Pseudomonadales bacterium]|nr:AAA family ATPase [Pseudomonadales bacterium]